MGKKRRRINEGLPKYVYRRKYGFIYRPYLGRVDGVTKWGKDVYIGGPRSTMAQIWTAYESVTGEDTNTVNWLLGKYHESERFKELTRRTQEGYEGYRQILVSKKLMDGGTLGSVMLHDIDMFTIRQYLDTYTDPKGRRAPIAANRHIQYLKAAWNWARQRFPEVPENPCLGVELNKQKPRDRLVTVEEYQAALALASGYVWVMMELAYLCRARRGEICALRHSDITEDGVRLTRTKGSEGEVTLWTPRLRAAVNAAKALNPSAPVPIKGGPYLLHDKKGLPIQKNAFDTAWQRLMKKYQDQGGERFTFHDLKAAGITRHKSNHGGHRSEKMRKVYVRDLPRIEATE